MQVNATAVFDWKRLFAANSTNNTDSVPGPTTTKPTGDGVVSVTGRTVPNNALFVFFGTDAADEAFKAYIIGWRKVGSLWVPTLLFTATCTLGTLTGVDGEDVDDTDFFADTIAASGTDDTDAYEIVDSATNRAALLKLDIVGFELIQVRPVRSTAASANCLMSWY